MMGRTPPAATNWPAEGDRRLPPPPRSLTAGLWQLMTVSCQVGTEQGGLGMAVGMCVAQLRPKQSQERGLSHTLDDALKELCPRCSSSMAADANFCRHCGHPRGKKVAQAHAGPCSMPLPGQAGHAATSPGAAVGLEGSVLRHA